MPPSAQFVPEHGELLVARSGKPDMLRGSADRPADTASRSVDADTRPPTVAATAPARRGLSIELPAAFVASAVFLALAGWQVRHGEFYRSGSGLGYLLGLIGGTMMLLLLLYPVRKHLSFMQSLGPLKYWFRFHMAAGIIGPLLVLFHSTFRVGSLNAGVALTCMLVVVASGLVGRFLYRKIHHGLYGSHATLRELQQALEKQLSSLVPQLRVMPMVKDEVDRFAALVSVKRDGWGGRSAHFLFLGWNRYAAGRRVRRAIATYVTPDDGHPALPHADIAALVATIDAALREAQRTAQFATYERLFSLWHVVHIPFLFLLFITALVHVVAVHIY